MQWVGGASLLAVAAGICTSAALFGVRASARQVEPVPAATASASRALVDKYCVRCHNQRARTGGLALDQRPLPARAAVQVRRPAAEAALDALAGQGGETFSDEKLASFAATLLAARALQK